MDEMIKNVVDVVFYSKYYYITDRDLKEDLLQEGRLAAYTLLASGEYNPTKDLRNYMYSWVWNAMSNYLYKQKKENCVDLDSVENLDIASYKTESVGISFDIKIVYDICKDYRYFGDYFNEVLIYLQDVGIIKNYTPRPSINISKELRDFVIGRVLYKVFKEEEVNAIW
jgi:hypothetical protein